MVDKVAAASKTRVPTGELNRFLERLTTQSPPVTANKRNVRVMYASQTNVSPPTIVLFTNSQTKLHFSYERFLENRLRDAYDFFGNPIRIQVRGRRNEKREKKIESVKESRRTVQRKPVKKGPGSKLSAADRARRARRAQHGKKGRKR